jgi:hypothetical protein
MHIAFIINALLRAVWRSEVVDLTILFVVRDLQTANKPLYLHYESPQWHAPAGYSTASKNIDCVGP